MRIKSKGRINVPLTPRIIPNDRTKNKHCKHCKINIEFRVFERLLKYVKEQDEKQHRDENYEEYQDKSGRWYAIKTIEEGKNFRITLITQEEMREKQMQEENKEKLETKRKHEIFMFSNEASPLRDRFRKDTKSDWKLVKKMLAPLTISDPVIKDDALRKLRERKIVLEQERCPCCQSRTKIGLVRFKENNVKPFSIASDWELGLEKDSGLGIESDLE